MGSILGDWHLFIFAVHFVQLNETLSVHVLLSLISSRDQVLWKWGIFLKSGVGSHPYSCGKNKHCHVIALHPHVTCEDDIVMTYCKKKKHWGFPLVQALMEYLHDSLSPRPKTNPSVDCFITHRELERYMCRMRSGDETSWMIGQVAVWTYWSCCSQCWQLEQCSSAHTARLHELGPPTRKI